MSSKFSYITPALTSGLVFKASNLIVFVERIKTIGEDLAAVHGYLCADGCVTSNPADEKHKYYRASLKNTEIGLLEDFASRFERVFGVRPNVYRRAGLSSLGNKEIYFELIQTFGSFYSYEWRFPELFRTKKLKSVWLRAVFDCEGWVYCKKGNDRHIGIEMVNRIGILKIKEILAEFGVHSGFKPKKNGKIFRLNIFGKENIARFSLEVGFLHPKKRAKLEEAIASFVDYTWAFPEGHKELASFLLLKLSGKRKKLGKRRIRVCSCFRPNLEMLQLHAKKLFGISAIVSGEQINRRGDSYFELSINRKQDIEKIKSLAKN